MTNNKKLIILYNDDVTKIYTLYDYLSTYNLNVDINNEYIRIVNHEEESVNIKDNEITNLFGQQVKMISSDSRIYKKVSDILYIQPQLGV